MFLKTYFSRLWHQTARQNNQNLGRLLEKNPQARVLDLGCDDGRLIKSRIKKVVGSEDIWGVDVDFQALAKAKKRGLRVFGRDLNRPLPFKDSFFDVVNANQIIEHLYDTDLFLEEVYRVLKPGGYFLISTENISSWHNIFSLVLGFQAPSQDISSKYRPGNPFSLCQKRPRVWTAHERIFSVRGLRSLLEVYSFKIETVLAAGYYPFPSRLAKILARLDPYHAAFIAIRARKKNH